MESHAIIIIVHVILAQRRTAEVYLAEAQLQLSYTVIVAPVSGRLDTKKFTAVATGNIEPAQAGSASSLFNMLRNLGGSIEIATLSTLLTCCLWELTALEGSKSTDGYALLRAFFFGSGFLV